MTSTNTSARIDVSCYEDFGRLLVYIADVATAIRLNSPYRGDYAIRDPREVGFAVMWLADSLHCFDRLGRALLSGDVSEIVSACDSLSSYYRMFTDGVRGSGAKGDPKASFKRYGHLCRPTEAMAVFSDIRGKALAMALEVGEEDGK